MKKIINEIIMNLKKNRSKLYFIYNVDKMLRAMDMDLKENFLMP